MNLLFAARILFLFSGIAFLLFKFSGFMIGGQEIDLQAWVEIVMFSVVNPVLIWFGATLLERLIKGANRSYEDLEAANRIAQFELDGRIQAQEALRSSEAKYRDLVENSIDITWETDASGKYSYCSSNVSAITGYRPDEYLGKKPCEFMPKPEGDRFNVVWETIYKNRTEFNLLTRQVSCKQGQIRILESSGRPVLDGAGHLLGFRGLDRDITERKEAEAHLFTLSYVADQSPNAVAIAGPDGSIEYVNHIYTAMTGYSSEEVLDRNFSILKLGEAAPEEYAKLWNIISSGGEWLGEFQNRRKNGDFYWASESITCLRDSTGAELHYIALVEDITERKRMEEQLLQSQKMESVGRLAGGIAHDFNNLLTAIMGYAQLGSMELPAGHPVAAQLDVIGQAADRAANLTRQLLAFSKQRQLSQR